MNILRPLSPHLPIYKAQLTSTFSIFHRISGAFLATLVFFFYLLCLKMGLICFTYSNFYGFFFYSAKLILISVEITALALSYHLYNGVRHLFHDFSFVTTSKKNILWFLALFFKAYAVEDQAIGLLSASSWPRPRKKVRICSTGTWRRGYHRKLLYRLYKKPTELESDFQFHEKIRRSMKKVQRIWLYYLYLSSSNQKKGERRRRQNLLFGIRLWRRSPIRRDTSK